MRKIYNEYFYVSKHEKVREKTIVTRLIFTIIVVISCLVAMSITAYAYFSCNISSTSNFIQSASFKANVDVKITDSLGNEVPVITSNYKSHLAALKANTEYFVTLHHTEISTAKTGFVIVTAEGSTESYHTQQLGQDGSGNTDTLSFYLVPSADMNVTFLAHWGTSSYYGYNSDSELYIKQGETVNISIKSITNNGEFSNDNILNTSSTTSVPTSSEPSTSTETTTSQFVTSDSKTSKDVEVSDLTNSSTPEEANTVETPSEETGSEQIGQGK